LNNKLIWLSRDVKDDLSKNQKKVLQFFRKAYKEIPLMSVDDVAKGTGVSPATVVRTVYALDYGSFKEFREDLQAYIQENVLAWPKFEKSFQNVNETSASTLQRITTANIRMLEELQNPQTQHSYDQFLGSIKKAERIFVLGARSSKAAASYLYNLFHQLTKDVAYLSNDTDRMYDSLIDITKDDIAIVISYGSPYYATSTIKAMKILRDREVPALLITDEKKNPATLYATHVLYLPILCDHYTQIAVINIIDALTTDLGKYDNTQKMNRLHRLLSLLKIESLVTDITDISNQTD